MSQRTRMTYDEREAALENIHGGLCDLARRLGEHFDQDKDPEQMASALALTTRAEQIAEALEYALDWRPA
jgi:hypothetical protein